MIINYIKTNFNNDNLKITLKKNINILLPIKISKNYNTTFILVNIINIIY